MGGLLSRILRFFGIGLAVVSNESEVLDQRASAAVSSTRGYRICDDREIRTIRWRRGNMIGRLSIP